MRAHCRTDPETRKEYIAKFNIGDGSLQRKFCDVSEGEPHRPYSRLLEFNLVPGNRFRTYSKDLEDKGEKGRLQIIDATTGKVKYKVKSDEYGRSNIVGEQPNFPAGKNSLVFGNKLLDLSRGTEIVLPSDRSYGVIAPHGTYYCVSGFSKPKLVHYDLTSGKVITERKLDQLLTNDSPGPRFVREILFHKDKLIILSTQNPRADVSAIPTQKDALPNW